MRKLVEVRTDVRKSGVMVTAVYWDGEKTSREVYPLKRDDVVSGLAAGRDVVGEALVVQQETT
jgi:hypothetical protein